jgi:hypothetical protein
MRIRAGRPLVAGIGCASRDLAGTPQELRSLAHREDDDNRRRHAGVFALVDWLYGDDVQWLYDTADDWMLYSHDHGWYLPPGGAEWTVEQLRATVSSPGASLGDTAGLDSNELLRLATAIEAVPDAAVAGVLSAVPPDWAVPSSDLDCLGWYIAERRSPVAARIRAINPAEATA